MEGEIHNLMQKLRLSSAEEEEVMVVGDYPTSVRERHDRCLVGALCTRRGFNTEAMKKTLLSLWKGSGCEIQEMGPNRFIFEFMDPVDKAKVLSMEPWSFDTHLLCLKEVDVNKPIGMVTFDRMVIWVQIHDLPMGCMSKEVGWLLGAKVGEVQRVDVDENGWDWGECLRVRVRVDITQPLKRGAILKFGGEKFWVSFRYERLPNFCFGYGRVGHSERECLEKSSEDVRHRPGNSQYGAWLRATVGKKSKAGNGGQSPNREKPQGCAGTEKGEGLREATEKVAAVHVGFE